jgi:glycosyltransferase involved in cell wall biosynthesis
MPPAIAPVVALDVTALIGHPLTGIQRLVLELVPRLCKRCFDRGLEVVLVHSLGPQLRSVCRWTTPAAPEEIQAVLQAVARGEAIWGKWRDVSRRLNRCGKIVGLGMLARHSRTVGLVNKHLRQFVAELFCGLTAACPPIDYLVGFSAGILPIRVPVEVDPDNVLLLLHDLIPLRHAQFVQPAVTRAFCDNLLPLVYPGGRNDRGYRLAAGSVSAAREIEQLFQELRPRPVRVRPVFWGYARETFYPDPDAELWKKLDLPPEARVVLAVSTRDPRKRFDKIAAAIHLLADEQPVYGVFIGHGTHLAASGDRLRYLGHVSDDLLRRAYSSCDLFVNWSACEGFGLPVVEALACGARVLVPPDNETLCEIGADDVLVAEGPSVAGLARSIARALAEPARPRVPDLSRFDWDQAATALEDELWAAEETPSLRLAPLRRAA